MNFDLSRIKILKDKFKTNHKFSFPLAEIIKSELEKENHPILYTSELYFLLSYVALTEDSNLFKAENYIRKAIEMSPLNSKYYVRLALYLHYQRKEKEALDTLNKVESFSLNSSHFYYVRSEILFQLKQYSEALQDSERAIKLCSFFYFEAELIKSLCEYQMNKSYNNSDGDYLNKTIIKMKDLLSRIEEEKASGFDFFGNPIKNIKSNKLLIQSYLQSATQKLKDLKKKEQEEEEEDEEEEDNSNMEKEKEEDSFRCTDTNTFLYN